MYISFYDTILLNLPVRFLLDSRLLHCREDKGTLNKLIETVRTNFNERYDAVSLERYSYSCPTPQDFSSVLNYTQVLTVYSIYLTITWTLSFCSWRRCGAAVSSARRAAPDRPASSAQRPASSAPKLPLNVPPSEPLIFLVARNALSGSAASALHLSLLNVIWRCSIDHNVPKNT